MQQLWFQIVHKSQYAYLAIAMAIIILATLCVFIMLLGWWKLGRQVTLSPIEVAKAFVAPSLNDAKSNANIDGLLKAVAHRRLRYGEVWNEVEMDENSEATIRFVRNGRCEKPQEGQSLQWKSSSANKEHF